MDDAVFKAFCLDAEKLSVRQLRDLGKMLRTLDARIDILAKIDRRRESIDRCLHCGHTALQRWGETPTGLQRFRCKSCGRTFSSATGSALARVRQPEKFHQVVDDMLTLVPTSCRKLAKRLGLDKMTIWRWRKRIIDTLTGVGGTDFGGIVEADEKFFRESRKGSREWVRHQRNPGIYPAPSRMRWEDYRRLKLPIPSLKYQIPVLTISDRSGARRADMLPSRQAGSLIALLARHIGPDAVLCSDGDPAYRVFAQSQAIPHYRLNAKTGPRVVQNAFHIQTVNNLHGRFERFMKPFCGPATKNLPGYAAWFIAKLIPDSEAAKGEVWRRLLAT